MIPVGEGLPVPLSKIRPSYHPTSARGDMDLVKGFIDFFLHLDLHLAEVIRSYGTSTYALLFLIVFLETGLVVTPLLPGDSLLFAAGSFAGLGALHLWPLYLLMCVAAIVGATVNSAF